ncbi:MAG: hypothetical protein V1899_03890 [Planctomycetota bacterium]
MLRIISVLLFVLLVRDSYGLAAQPGDDSAQKNPEKYAGKVRADILLDETTGFLTYLLRCTSDEPVKIHMESLAEAEIWFRIKPDVDSEKVKVDFDDGVFSHAYTPVPYRDWVERTLTREERMSKRAKEKAMDRVVELKKNEAISRSFYLYDMPWFDALVKKLETKKFKAYRIDPWPFVYTADGEGKPIRDHQVDVWEYENKHAGNFKVVYFTGGLIFDLARAKKIQAMRPKKPVETKKD